MNMQGQVAGAGLKHADQGRRIIAAAIDGGVAMLLALLHPAVGGILAAAFMLLRDGLNIPSMSYQSPGKRAVGIQAVRVDGRPMDPATSIQRNLPLAIVYFGGLFALFPIVGKFLAPLLALSGAGLGILELVLVLTDPDGKRLGDRLAATMVISVEAPGPTST